MNRILAVLTLALLLPACGNEKYDYLRTPAGYSLAWENVGAVDALYSLNDILDSFDMAVERAKTHLAKYGVAPQTVESYAKSCKHIGIDGARFKIDASPTGYASGAYYVGHQRIVLAFWTRASGNVVPPDAPAWTVYSWPQRPDPAYDWGVEPPSFPALGHEIGHAIFGGAFEHGWTPPVVAGFSVLAVPNWEGHCAYLHE